MALVSQGLTEKKQLGIGNVNTPAKRFLGTILCIDYLHSGVNSILTCFFVFVNNVSYYKTLKMKRKLFEEETILFFITLINLGAQIRGAQTQYTIANFGLNQPLSPSMPLESIRKTLIF